MLWNIFNTSLNCFTKSEKCQISNKYQFKIFNLLWIRFSTTFKIHQTFLLYLQVWSFTQKVWSDWRTKIFIKNACLPIFDTNYFLFEIYFCSWLKKLKILSKLINIWWQFQLFYLNLFTKFHFQNGSRGKIQITFLFHFRKLLSICSFAESLHHIFKMN